MSTYREERIRQLAHEIWEREGHPHGRDAEHWRMATEAYEAELARSRVDAAGQAIEAEGDGNKEPEAPREWTLRVPAVATPSGATANQPLTAAPAALRKRRTKAEMEAARAAEAAVIVSPARRNRKLSEVVSADTPASARRGRKPQTDTPPASAETAPAHTRKRRTKAEMAAAALAAGAVAASAAAVAATVTKRRRGAKADTPDSAAPAEASSSRRSRKVKTETAGEAAPAPAADAALKRPRRSRGSTKHSEADPAAVAATSAVTDPSADGPLDVATGVHPDPDAAPPSEAALKIFPETAPEAELPGERTAD